MSKSLRKVRKTKENQKSEGRGWRWHIPPHFPVVGGD